MEKQNSFCLCVFVSVVFIFVYQSDAAVCVDKNSKAINETHPSAANNWTDTEQWNATQMERFCPGKGTISMECIDEKGEGIGTYKNGTVYTATCTPVNGLLCQPVDKTKDRCPDFSVTYSCKCPPTTTLPTTTLHKTATSGRDYTTTSTARSTSNPPQSSSTRTGTGTGTAPSTSASELGDRCSSISDCSAEITGSTCETNICVCAQNYRKENGACVKKENGGNGGLSTGLIAGIAAGSILLLLFILIVVIMYYFKNKHINKVRDITK